MTAPPITRRQLLQRTGVAVAGIAAVGALSAQTALPQADQAPATPVTNPLLDAFNASIASGGPPKDGIPPIDEPRFVAAAEMDYLLKPDDQVFVLIIGDEIRVYPQLVLVWHEIVSDTIGGEPVSVTYCPLTGSVVAFTGTAPDGSALTLGTSGNLVNSNLLMYDRQTDSQWPQMLGQAINGEMKGSILTEIPLVWTSWERWKAQEIDAPVLSADTGHLRSYGQDPYGVYAGDEKGYYESDDVIFPLLYEDDRFEPKDIVVGVKAGNRQLAIPRPTAIANGAWNLTLANSPIVAVHDAALDTVWVFSRQLEDRTISLRMEHDALLDEGDGAWTISGATLTGPNGELLPTVPFYDAMWFSWYAFYPETEVAG